MKKVIISLVFLCFSLVSFSQSSFQHLKFKGVEIDGTLEGYVDKMKGEGFEFFGIKNGVGVLKGEFAGYRDCNIIASTLKSIDKVNCIKVEFPDRKDWPSLEGDYINLKSMLTEKYGKPSEVIEEFKATYQPELDRDKLYLVERGDYSWYSIFSTKEGDIQISISNNRQSRSGRLYVELQYSDKTNTEEVRARAMEDL